MTHEMFRLASATREQLDIVMMGVGVLAVVVVALALWVAWEKRRLSASKKPKRPSKTRKRWRGSG